MAYLEEDTTYFGIIESEDTGAGGYDFSPPKIKVPLDIKTGRISRCACCGAKVPYFDLSDLGKICSRCESTR